MFVLVILEFITPSVCWPKYKRTMGFCLLLFLFSSEGCYCSNIPKLTNTEVRKKRCEIYNKEKERQQALITRIEKIKVIYEGIPENCTLIMNKKLSTPYNCAMREYYKFRGVVLLWSVIYRFCITQNLCFTFLLN